MSRARYFWDFGQVQLLTDTRECVQFLGTVCSRHRMWEKAVNTTMPAQIFRIVEFQWDGCRCSGLGLNIVDISSKCSGAMWVLRRLQMEACRKLPFLSSLQPPVHVRLVSIIYLSLIYPSMSAPAVKIATENVKTRDEEMRRVTAEWFCTSCESPPAQSSPAQPSPAQPSPAQLMCVMCLLCWVNCSPPLRPRRSQDLECCRLRTAAVLQCCTRCRDSDGSAATNVCFLPFSYLYNYTHVVLGYNLDIDTACPLPVCLCAFMNVELDMADDLTRLKW